MPKTTSSTQQDLILPMPDFTIGSEVFQRKFTFSDMEYSCSKKRVVISGYISFFKNGVDVTDTSVWTTRQNRSMTADNTTVCYSKGQNAGVTICPVDNVYDDDGSVKIQGVGDDTDPSSPCYDKDYDGEFNFFFDMAENAQIVVNEMILNFLNMAIQSGRFDK